MESAKNELKSYLLERELEMTDEWLSRRVKRDASIYSSEAPSHLERDLRKSNLELIQILARIFDESREQLVEDIEEWASVVSEKRVSLGTPFQEVIEQIQIFQEIFWNKIEGFAIVPDSGATIKHVFSWRRKINWAFNQIILTFIEQYFNQTTKKLKAQQEMIQELSSPVIPIADDIGVLPLIGDFDSQRAHKIIELTLEQCSDLQISHLFIDLSGVPLLDTMVARKIFQVVQSLKLLGVKATLSGLRPEVAQTAVQLGIDFKDVGIQRNLAKALASMELKAN